jgi:alpha-ketoglutarate-dependent taurine dioxygenase
VLVRGLRFDLVAFEAFCSLFGDRAIVHPATAMGTRRAVTGTTATVDAGVLPFPWHAELSYAPGRPDLVAFACERAPAEGGETLLTDGCAIAGRLSRAGRSVAASRVRYTYNRAKRTWPATFGAVTRREADRALRELASGMGDRDELAWSFRRLPRRRVSVEYTTPILSPVRWGEAEAFCNHVVFQERRNPGAVAVLDDGSRIPPEAVDEFERLADEASSAIRWREGDVVVVDNSRVMHARRRVTGADRTILARLLRAKF